MNDLDAIKSRIDDFYEVISGSAGQERDWAKMRSLFIPGASVTICPAAGSRIRSTTTMGIEPYIENLGRFLKDRDFYEIGIIHHTEKFGNIASVISTYEARKSSDEEEPLRRGVNFIHLCYDNDRWLITNMIWRDEDEDYLLPDKYR